MLIHYTLMRKSVLLLLCSAALVSCFKENIDPKYRNSSFTCQIDGQTFNPLKFISPQVQPFTVLYCPTGSQGYLSHPAGFLSIQGIDARHEVSVSGSLNIQKLGVFGVGEYPLSYQECSTFSACDASWYTNTKEWKFATKAGQYYADNGKLIITKLDTVSRRITAQFHFEAKDLNGKKLRVTNGAFNLPYTLVKPDGSSALD